MTTTRTITETLVEDVLRADQSYYNTVSATAGEVSVVKSYAGNELVVLTHAGVKDLIVATRTGHATWDLQSEGTLTSAARVQILTYLQTH